MKISRTLSALALVSAALLLALTGCASKPQVIKTIHGSGYMFVSPK